MNVLKRTWLKTSCCLFFLLFLLVIPSGYFFPYEEVVQAEEIISADSSIENELLIYTPEEMLSFNIEDYLLHNAPHLVEYAEIISHWCGYSSISPKIIIALIEYQTGLISNAQPDPNDMEKPLSSLSDRTGFSMQVKDVAAQLADAYYSWHKNQQALDQNILQNFLDEKSNVQLKAQQQGFRNLYYQLFPESSESGKKQLQAPTVGATPPDNLLQLPYPVGESWNYGGSHTNNGSGDYPQSSLDFNGGSWNWGADTSDLWVVAAHGGQVVVHSSCNVEVIGSDGWSTTYYHLDNVVVETNQTVTRNTPLANYADNKAQAICQGGSSSGPHVHFSLKYDGSYEHLDGVKLSGFSVHTGRDSYDSDCDYFWLEKNGTKYCAWRDLENPGVAADTCSVPANLNATDIEETTATLNWGAVSSAQSYDIRYKATSGNSWFSTSSSTNSVMISGLTAATEYEFQVRTVCSDETSDYSSSAYFTTYDGVSSKTVGETTVFSTTTNATNRRAVSYTMPEDGTIESITMYHKAGSGNMILGIYDGENDPANLLGKTASVEVSGSDGWQTVELQSPVFVSGGETIWFAWVLETNDGILVYEAGDDPRSDAGVGWSAGMPDSFGSGSLANYDYSIYASYTAGGATRECSAPSNLDATDIEETTATLNWGSVSSVQSYDIRYKSTSDDNWIPTSSSTYSKTISGLTAATEYEFQVRTVCSNGETSDYSASANFTTSEATQECSVSSELNVTDIEETAATLNWESVSSAQSYDIRYKSTSDNSWLSTSSSTSSVIISDLTTATDYEFQVKTVCSDGTSDYSPSASFTTSGTTQECSVPSKLDATDITENSTTLTWSQVSSATGYRIQYRTVGTGTWTTITSSNPFADISGLVAGTQYEFQVQTICSSSDSDYSDAITFTTLGGGETDTVGNTDIFSTTTNATNRRAVSYTIPEDGTVQSITMYHKAGSGNMILAVYEGESKPTNLLGKSETVAVAGTDGWQTVNLQTPVHVDSGKKIWLAWVLEKNPGIIVYRSGSVPRAHSVWGRWSAGMPDRFGYSRLANYEYSIYATYIPD